MTLLKASIKQFLAADKSPFFQIQLPKLNHASPRDGFNLTFSTKNS